METMRMEMGIVREMGYSSIYTTKILTAIDSTLEASIRAGIAWRSLPPDIKRQVGNSKTAWEAAVLRFCIQHRLRWRSSLARQVMPDERAYYTAIVQAARQDLTLYPYSLSAVLHRGLHLTPVAFYREIFVDLMKDEKSYDTLPNFTAADALRLVGIGRNQYIDLMNRIRSKGWLWKRRRAMIADLLPQQSPAEFSIEPWWLVCVGYVSEDDVNQCNDIERATLDILIDVGPRQAGELERSTVLGLVRRGLVFLEVPVSPDDRIEVPPLEGFVMNRVRGDAMETLLYKIFVSMDENTTVEELAGILQEDVSVVQNAVSVYCRLGFARKRGEGTFDEKRRHPSWQTSGAITRLPPPMELTAAPVAVHTEEQTGRRVAFVFDSTLTAFLMMGNLTSGLKTHAVTLFEVGRLGAEAVGDLLNELDKVDATGIGEGDAARYFLHAITLRSTLKCLRDSHPGGVDMLRAESLFNLEEEARSRVLRKNYDVIVSMCPLSLETPAVCPREEPAHFGSPVESIASPWFRLLLSCEAEAGPPAVILVCGTRLRRIPAVFEGWGCVVVCPWNRDPSVVRIGALLGVSNEMLMHAPLLIQGYSKDSEPAQTGIDVGGAEGMFGPGGTGSHRTIDVALPLESDPDEVQQGSDPNGDLIVFDDVDEEVRAPTVVVDEGLQQHPVVRRISRRLGLHWSIGFLRMIQVEKEWLPLELHLGVPLFDGALNESICQRIQQHDMFAESAVNGNGSAMRKLTSLLSAFVMYCQHPDSSEPRPWASLVCEGQSMGSGLPFPSRDWVFDGESLKPLEF